MIEGLDSNIGRKKNVVKVEVISGVDGVWLYCPCCGVRFLVEKGGK